MIFAANFKANHTMGSVSDYLDSLVSLSDSKLDTFKVFVFPPFTAIQKAPDPRIVMGAQNGYAS